MKRSKLIVLFLILLGGCDSLDPDPVDLTTNELALNEAGDVPAVRIGLYNSLRSTAAPIIILNDLATDITTHNGTFSEYRELSNKDITSANAIFSTIWSSYYRCIYNSNFIMERLPDIKGVSSAERRELLGSAHFCRGYSYFMLVYCFGDVPLTTSSEVEPNKILPRANKEEVLALAKQDLEYALENLPTRPSDATFAGVNTARAALARFHLYQNNWALAEQYASDIINSNQHELVYFEEVVNKELTKESILEVAYSTTDDPGTGNYSLSNLFQARREIIPTDQTVVLFFSKESASRISSLDFKSENLKGNDNGWSVVKYSSDADNNNIILFRLGEIYLIRAEARARLNRLAGENSAENDINRLRLRASLDEGDSTQYEYFPVSFNSQPQALSIIERERIYELAFEGHRWFDLVRTGRANEVMSDFTRKWNENYNVWPIPIREIQNNPSLKGAQNPGY